MVQSPDKTINQGRDFLTETHPTRENSKMFVQNPKDSGLNLTSKNL